MRGITGIGDAICLGHFFKSAVLLVDEEFVFPVVTFDIAGIAYVDVQPAVSIDVGHTYTSRPGFAAIYPCLLGYVFELPIAFIEVEAILFHVGGKIDVDQTVVVDVTQGHTTPVVKIAVGVDVEIVVKMQLIDKINTRYSTGHFGEQGIGFDFRGLLQFFFTRTHPQQKDAAQKDILLHVIARFARSFLVWPERFQFLQPQLD